MERNSVLGYAILGLLHQGARSGYDLRKVFANTPIGTFRDSPGAIYPALQRLENQGLARGHLHASSGRRRRVFHPTAAGKRSFKAWQTKSISTDDIIHRMDELMLRFAFMDETAGPAQAQRFLRNLMEGLRRYAPSLRQFLKANGPQMSLSGRLALESGVRDYEEMLRWCRSALAKYANRRKGGRRT